MIQRKTMKKDRDVHAMGCPVLNAIRSTQGSE